MATNFTISNMEQLLTDVDIVLPDNLLSPEEIDSEIINQIDKATAKNSSIWTCPDYNRREYTHSFFQYPARMIPAVQKKLIEIIVSAKPDIENMIDPFMGSATTLVACMEMGLNCFGQDINPLSVLIAKVRTGPYHIKSLEDNYFEILQNIKNDDSDTIEITFVKINKWFKPSIQIELSKIVRAIKQVDELAIRQFFWVVLAETVRLCSNDRTSTFKMHMRPIEEIERRNFSALLVFELHVEKSIDDFRFHAQFLNHANKLDSEGAYVGEINLNLLNSKDSIFSPICNDPYFGLLVTSPPYGDNRTTVPYGQSSFLPLLWIDLKDIDELATSDLLKTSCEIDNRSLGGNLSELDNNILEYILEKSPSFKKVYSIIKERDYRKLSKVVSFVIDLNQTLDNIFKVMLPNSYQIWTTGNRTVANTRIPNDQIIIELMNAKGGILVKKIGREIINKRMAKRNNGSELMTREDILIFRKIARR